MKNCGVLMHISSLPSPYGIGDLGAEAYEFVDFLSGAGQTYWQVLPIGPTSYGDSPYQSPSGFAGNPYFIDLRALNKCGLITDEELKAAEMPVGKVGYGALFACRPALLKKAYGRFKCSDREEYKEFCRKNAYWLDSYALFTALKNEFSLRPHWEWEREYKFGSEKVRGFAESHLSEINYVKFEQFVFNMQWKKLRTYANSKGIKIIGDTPIYAAYDSADFWEDPSRFTVDGNGNPAEVAGVPPDYFSADGQLWGNPLYNWEYLGEHGYDYWINKVRRASELFDMLRIDHFRGFCAYYAIPAGSENARIGEWKQGPGKALFDAIDGALGKVNILAEDLGVDSPELRTMLIECGYPGMKVLQFGFGGNARYNAHAVCNCREGYFGYTGTHDNDTTLGWFDSLPAPERKRVRSRLKVKGSDVCGAMINALYGTRVTSAIVPMQDLLGEGSESRMNVPGKSGGNWQYRIKKMPAKKLQAKMLAAAKAYKRDRTK